MNLNWYRIWKMVIFGLSVAAIIIAWNPVHGDDLNSFTVGAGDAANGLIFVPGTGTVVDTPGNLASDLASGMTANGMTTTQVIGNTVYYSQSDWNSAYGSGGFSNLSDFIDQLNTVFGLPNPVDSTAINNGTATIVPSSSVVSVYLTAIVDFQSAVAALSNIIGLIGGIGLGIILGLVVMIWTGFQLKRQTK